jgi:hypothetical protein
LRVAANIKVQSVSGKPARSRVRFSAFVGELLINVAKLLRAYGGCLGIRRR